MHKNKRLISALLSSVFLLIGCNGDEVIGTGIDDKIEGLKLPSSIDVVTAKEENSINAINPMNGVIQAVFSDTGTDYSNDTSEMYSDSVLQSSLDMANVALCMLDKIKIDIMVNKGPYTALLSDNVCDTENRADTTAANFTAITAVSERKDNQSAQTIKVWFSYSSPDSTSKQDLSTPLATIIEGEIYERVSIEKPFGDFSLSYKYIYDDGAANSISADTATLTLRTDTSLENGPQFKYLYDFNFQESGLISQGSFSANITLNPSDRQQGKILGKTAVTGNGIKFYELLAGQFDNNNILQGKASATDSIFDPQACSSRNSVKSSVDNYWLYHEFDGKFRGRDVTAGERISQYTSQIISYQGSIGEISYDSYRHSGDEIPDGATVFQSNKNSEASSLHFSPGKLEIHSSINILLSDLENRSLRYFGLHPDPNFASFGYATWLVRVVAGKFEIEGVFNSNGTGDTISATIDHDSDPSTDELLVATTLVFTTGETTLFTDLDDINSYDYKYDENLAVTDRTINKTANNIYLLPSDPLIYKGAVTLYCYLSCPKGGIDQAMVDNAASFNDLYYAYVDIATTRYEYTIQKQDHKTVLIDMSNGKIVDTYGLKGTTSKPLISNMLQIFRSGQLLLQPLIEPVTISQLYDTTDYYIWQTSNNRNYSLATLVDSSGAELIFDRPLNFSYRHDAANDRNNTNPTSNPYHGKLYNFSDGKFLGTLDEMNNYRTPFSILDGTQLSNDEGSFIVKAIEIAQSPQPATLDQCSNLNIDNIASDSSLNQLTPDDIVPVTLKLSDKPTVTGLPAIIDGVVQ